MKFIPLTAYTVVWGVSFFLMARAHGQNYSPTFRKYSKSFYFTSVQLNFFW